MRKLLLAASMAALIGSPAAAAVNLNQPSRGYTYFHKAGATLEAHDAQVRECLKQNSFRQPSPNSGQYAAGQGLAGVIAAVIVDAAIMAMQADNVQLTNLENCMVLHGWDVVQIPDADGEAMAKLEQAAMHAALEPLVGAEAPKGEVIRTYDNDMGKADTVAFATIGPIDKKSFSRLALPDVKEEPGEKPEGDVKKVSAPKLPKMPKTAKPPIPTTLAKLPAVPENSALLLVRMTDPQVAPTLTFRRRGPDDKTPAWVDGAPAEAGVTMPMAGFWTLKPASPDGVAVIVVPPGRWVLDTVSLGLMGVHLCYGAPAIEVAAGDVVYLGAFTQKTLLPNMDLEPARVALQAKPDLAGKLKAAKYTNGNKGSCGGIGYGYALEIPDAPYEKGYSLGSKARLAAVTPAVSETGAVDAEPAEATPLEAAPPEAAPIETPTAEPVADPTAPAAETTLAPSAT